MNCVVKAHHAGLFSNLNKVVTCMRMYDHVWVDWSSGGVYGDCWGKLFAPRTAPRYLSSPCAEVSSYPFYELTSSCAGAMYQNIGWGWRDVYNLRWIQLDVRGDVADDAKALVADATVAVQIRSNAIAGEQLFGRMQTLDEYAAAVDRTLRQGEKLFVLSSDEESLAWMCSRFPCVFDPNVRRGAQRELPEPHTESEQTWEDARRCLVEVMAAASCRAIIHPISNMATAALYINPYSTSVYLK
jgi:hypothetical protein